MKKEETKVVEKEAEQNKYPNESLQHIEDERLVFWKSYKTHNSLKLVVMFICLAVIIVAWIVFSKILANQGALQSGLSIGVSIIGLGATYGYSVYVRKKFEKKMKDYFELYFNAINEYVFDKENYTNVELQNPGKIILEEFNESNLYKDVVETGSRGLTNFKYKKEEISIVDCAGNVKAEKRMKPVFVGKMVRAKASYKGDVPVIVYLKGNERALPPTNVAEIKNVFEDQKMVVYSNYKDWKKVLTAGVMKVLESIKTDKILVDVAISIANEKVFVMMGYDDPLMVLPLQNEFDYKPTEIYKKDILAVSKLIEALNK